MKDIAFVTGNQNKLREVQDILGIELESVDLDIPEIQSLDVREVVKAKAEAAYKFVQKPLIVEDVSMEVATWNNLPGPLVKWFLKTVGTQGMLRMLMAENKREAVSKCVVDVYDGDEHQVFVGEVKGSISMELRGENGFGFDVLFIPDGDERTFAEMTDEEKNACSHRFKAFEQVREWMGGNG